MSKTRNMSKLARYLANPTETNTNISFTSELVSSSGSGTQTYTNIADLPLTGNTTGAEAFVEENNRLYIWNGTGWYNIAIVNTTPTAITGASGSYAFALDGTPIELTLASTDPEGFPIIWSYEVTSGSLTNGGGTTATILQNNNAFTITPSTNVDHEGTFGITFTASDGVNITSFTSIFSLAFVQPSGVFYSTPGTYSWTAPADVRRVSVVCVGGGGGGVSNSNTAGAGAAGGGGGMGWKNLISVTPGQTYTVVVGAGGTAGASGGNSYFIDTNTVAGFGGGGGTGWGDGNPGGAGGGYIGDGGGNGGRGGNGNSGTGNYNAAAGGGAGGYSGNGTSGHDGGYGTDPGPFDATGGAAAGGGGTNGTFGGNGGGGVGIYGQGTSGVWPGGPGSGGSAAGGGYQDGTRAGDGIWANGCHGGVRGGGGGGSNPSTANGGSHVGGSGGKGAVRIIWGAGRLFPSTNVDLASSTDGETTI